MNRSGINNCVEINSHVFSEKNICFSNYNIVPLLSTAKLRNGSLAIGSFSRYDRSLVARVVHIMLTIFTIMLILYAHKMLLLCSKFFPGSLIFLPKLKYNCLICLHGYE